MAPFKAALREKLLLTKYYFDELRKIKNIRIINEPKLSIFAYRYEDPSLTGKENNLINKKLIEEIHRDGKIFLSSTTIQNQICLRIAILSFRTHLDEINIALTEIKTKIDAIITKQ